jgi:hypothetical protein
MIPVSAIARPSLPSPLASSATSRTSFRRIARCPILGQDPPPLLQVSQRTTSCEVSVLNLCTAYVAACQASTANVTVPATEVALTLPPDWDGPTDEHLNLGETIIYVGVGAMISVGSIVILCTM